MMLELKVLGLLRDLLTCTDPQLLQILRAEINHCCLLLSDKTWPITASSATHIITVVNGYCEHPHTQKAALLTLIDDIENGLRKKGSTV